MKAIATNQLISWFYQRFKEDSLELSPDFQRNPVWQQPQKDYLIETILLELPIPEIYLINKIKPSGEVKYVVVDGQQRLRTIIEFINGDLKLKTSPNSFPHIKQFSSLNDEEKQRFWRYPIVVRDLEDSKDREIRDLFQRLNKYSIVLSDQELRNARFKGKFIKVIEKLSEHEFWVESGLFSSNDIRRMLDLEFISILLTTLMAGIFNRKDRLDEFYVNYEEDFEEENYVINQFNKILEIIDILVPDIRKKRWKNKGDFFTLFITLDDLEIDKTDLQKLEQLKTTLIDFEQMVQFAKNNLENTEKKIRDYYEASTLGTNDKEKRVRRHKILLEFLKTNLPKQKSLPLT